MIKTPDIQDVGDVERFAQRAFYPLKRNRDGEVEAVAYIRGIDGNYVSTAQWSNEVPTESRVTITFEEFLKLEQGYYKSRLVDYNGSVVYLTNHGANEQTRNHAYRPEVIRITHLHEEATYDWGSVPFWKQAQMAYNNKRISPYTAITQLEQGKIVGCALSDNFGLITTSKSPNIQVIRRSKIVGELDQFNRPVLYRGSEHYTMAVQKLWR